MTRVPTRLVEISGDPFPSTTSSSQGDNESFSRSIRLSRFRREPILLALEDFKLLMAPFKRKKPPTSLYFPVRCLLYLPERSHSLSGLLCRCSREISTHLLNNPSFSTFHSEKLF
ncbi:unnamed protein product [Cochlearia groenlandica]